MYKESCYLCALLLLETPALNILLTYLLTYLRSFISSPRKVLDLSRYADQFSYLAAVAEHHARFIA